MAKHNLNDQEARLRKLDNLEEKARKRTQRFIERRAAQGKKRALLWLDASVLDAVDDLAKKQAQSRSDVIETLISTSLQRKRGNTKEHAIQQPVEDGAEIPKEALPSRTTAALLGFKTGSALDNAVNKAGYTVGFVKAGMANSGKQARFIGKSKAKQGGPARNMWVIEDK